jgi:ketosteroid isomerase-like protein
MAKESPVTASLTSSNKAVVQRYFHEVLDGKRIDLMPELMRDDVVLHRPGFDVLGLQAAMARLRATLRDFVAFSSEITGTIADADMVGVRIAHRARARPHVFRSRVGDVDVPAEQELNWMAIVQFRLQDGKIAEEWVMRDELAMLMQIGNVAVTRR